MAMEHEDQTLRRDAHGAALTPRPVRLLLIGRIAPGNERTLREIQAGFPFAAAAEAGISAIEAFIGSGYYAIELEIGADDPQRVLADFFNDGRVRKFRASLEPLVESFPDPAFHFGVADRFQSGTARSTTAEATSVVYNTGDLPFAASMYRWREGEEPQTGKEPLGRLGR